MRRRSLLLALVWFLSAPLVLLPGCASQGQKRPPAHQQSQAILEQARQAFMKKEYQRVFQLVFPLAVAGNAQAQYTLGYLYHHGLGVEKSDRQAMNWIQRAAAQGHKKAQAALRRH